MDGGKVYFPTEVLSGERYTEAADVYCFGLLACELFHGQRLLVEFEAEKIKHFIQIFGNDNQMTQTNKSLKMDRIPTHLSYLLQHCLCANPNNRPKICDVQKRWDDKRTR